MDIVCVSPSTIRDCAGDAGSLSLLSWLALTTEVGRVARTAGEPGCVDVGRRSPRMLLMRLSTSALRSRSWLRRGVGDSTCAACQCCCTVNTGRAGGRTSPRGLAVVDCLLEPACSRLSSRCLFSSASLAFFAWISARRCSNEDSMVEESQWGVLNNSTQMSWLR